MKTKLKDLKYQIEGTETFKPAKELTKALVIAFLLDVVIVIAIFLVASNADKIDSL